MVNIIDIPIREIRSRGFRPMYNMRYILLKQSIEKNGFNRNFPTHVCRGSFAGGKKYRVLEGNHRFYICLDLGYETIPCVIEKEKQ